MKTTLLSLLQLLLHWESAIWIQGILNMLFIWHDYTPMQRAMWYAAAAAIIAADYALARLLLRKMAPKGIQFLLLQLSDLLLMLLPIGVLLVFLPSMIVDRQPLEVWLSALLIPVYDAALIIGRQHIIHLAE